MKDQQASEEAATTGRFQVMAGDFCDQYRPS